MAFETPETGGTPEIIQQLLDGLLGDPRLGQMISGPITQALAPVLQGSIHGPGDFQAYGTSNYLAGTTGSPGMHAYHQFNNRAMQSMMQSTQDAVKEAERQNAQNALQFFGQDEGSAIADSNNMFSMTNFLSKMQFGTHKPGELLQGLGEASRYMGAGQMLGLGPGGAAFQAELNASAGNVTSAIAKDFFTNMESYGGLDGKEVGQVTAELARTGALDTSNIEGSKESVKEMSRTVRALRQFFEGDVADLIDNINGLSGTNFQATFGGSADMMINNLSATGFATGHTNQDMLRLANSSAGMMRQMGVDPTSALSNAGDIASIMAVSRVSGGSEAFINEARYRDNMTYQVTRANQSSSSRLASGAAALIAGRLNAKGEFDVAKRQEAVDFVDSLSPGMLNDPSAVAAQLQSKFGINTTGTGLMSASYTQEADTLRSQGVGTDVAMQAFTGRIDDSRRLMLSSMARREGLDIGSLMGSLEGGPLTADRIRTALEGQLGANDPRAAAITGELRQNFDEDAKAMRLGSSYEADRMLRTMNDSKMFDIIDKQSGFRTALQDMTSEMGTVTGIRAISKLAGQIEGDVTMKAAFQTLTGNIDIDLNDENFQQLLGTGNSKMKGMTKEHQLSVGVAFQAMMGSIDGEAVSEETAAEAAAALGGGGSNAQRLERILKFGHKHGSEQFDKLEKSKLTAEIHRNAYGKKAGSLDSMAAARKRAEQIMLMDDLDPVSEKGGLNKGFEKTKKEYRDFLLTSKDPSVDFWDDKREMTEEKFKETMNRQTKLQGGGLSTTNDLLNQIMILVESFKG